MTNGYLEVLFLVDFILRTIIIAIMLDTPRRKIVGNVWVLMSSDDKMINYVLETVKQQRSSVGETHTAVYIACQI